MINPLRARVAGGESTGGEVANALVCKTSIRGFNSRPVLHKQYPLPWPLLLLGVGIAASGSRKSCRRGLWSSA